MNDEPTIHMTVEPWQSETTSALLRAILRLESVDEAAAFFRDLCTLGELHDMAQRWAVVRLLDAGLHYGEISTLTGASTATITRIAQWLHHGQGGYRMMLERSKSDPIASPRAHDGPALSGAAASPAGRSTGSTRARRAIAR